MGKAMIDEDLLREDLRTTYGRRLPPAAFDLDDVRQGGRRRVRRRTVTRVAGAGIATAALVAAMTAGTGLLDGPPTATTPAARPSGSGTSCTTDMGECAWRVSQWAKDAGVPYPDVDRFTLDPAGAAWQKGTWRLETTLTIDHDGRAAQTLAVTLSPTTTDPVGSRIDRTGLATATLRLEDGEVATSYRESGALKSTVEWQVPARAGVHPAVSVEFAAVDDAGNARGGIPAAAAGPQVRGLLEVLTGPGRTEVPAGTRDEVRRPGTPTGPATVAEDRPADPHTVVRAWLRDTGHADVAPPASRPGPAGWDVVGIPVEQDRLTVRVSSVDPYPSAQGTTEVQTPSGLAVRKQSATFDDGTQDDWTLADKRFRGRVSVSLLHPTGQPAVLGEDDVLRLVDALATR